MTKRNTNDIFKAFLVEKADFDGDEEIPLIKNEDINLPTHLSLFSKRKGATSYNSWICFYEDDYKFECLWNNPKRYLNILKKFQGVILPDFSTYRDMPLLVQKYNIYRSRALGNWLLENKIPIIPNIRWGDDRTLATACLGIEQNSIISIGTHGIIKSKESRKHLILGLEYVVKRLKPRAIIIYGTAPKDIFEKYEKQGIKILQFDSEVSKFHKRGE